MTHKDADDYSRKHSSHEKPDTTLAEAVRGAAEGGRISCAAVFRIFAAQNVEASEAGKTVDQLNIKLVRCQLGLFGNSPEQGVLEPVEDVPHELVSAIRNHLVEGRLPCANAWKIAEELNLKRTDVGCAAETLNIRIKPCQLGAF